MPELPEVETIARLIRPNLVGRRIESVRVDWERALGGRSKASFGRLLRGACVYSVGRRAKYIVIELKRGGTVEGSLLVHLRMTGRLNVDPEGTPEHTHTRVTCLLDNGAELRFIDVRKFGRFSYHDDPSEVFAALGPEPLSRGFDESWLGSALAGRKRALKPLLLDQSFLAGLGNIYVDECLHQARLHPLTRADRVKQPKVAALTNAIRETLTAAIERQGSSFDKFYRTPEGQPGSYQHEFQVYGRAGNPCYVCGRRITRIVVGQRGTHLCTRCQPAPRYSR